MGTETESRLSQQRTKRNVDRRDRDAEEETEERGGSWSPGRAARTAEVGAGSRAGVAEGLVWSVNWSQEGRRIERKTGEMEAQSLPKVRLCWLGHQGNGEGRVGTLQA